MPSSSLNIPHVMEHAPFPRERLLQSSMELGVQTYFVATKGETLQSISYWNGFRSRSKHLGWDCKPHASELKLIVHDEKAE